MSPRERKAWRRYDVAWHATAGDGFDMTSMPIDNPRGVAAYAARLAGAYERNERRVLGKDAWESARVLKALAAAAQGYADVHEQAEQERARQAQRSE